MGEGDEKFGRTNLGEKSWTSHMFRFPTIIIFVTFWTGGKNSPGLPWKEVWQYRLIFLQFYCDIFRALLEI